MGGDEERATPAYLEASNDGQGGQLVLAHLHRHLVDSEVVNQDP